MTNYMEQVAKMLGVELNEEFEIVFPAPSSCHATAMFTNEGVKVISTDVYDVYNFKAYLLRDILTGAYGIKRKPWKPKDGDEYWLVKTDGCIGTDTYYTDCSVLVNYYKLGNCYRTQEEAQANIDKWIGFYNSDEVLDIPEVDEPELIKIVKMLGNMSKESGKQ